MGKHKSSTQNTIIIKFMEKYPDLAKGCTKRDKPTVNALWEELADSLNSAGPPQFDVNGWKKKWTEWKSEVKKKLAQNKAESRATGGGPFAKHLLTTTEEAIVRLCGISQLVEGVSGVAVGLNEDAACEKEVPSTSSKRPLSPVVATNTAKRYKTENTGDRLKKFLDEDDKRKKEMNDKLDEFIQAEKEKSSSLRHIHRVIEKGNESVANAVTDLKKEFAHVSTAILKSLQEKNELKKRQLDLELQKFEYKKNLGSEAVANLLQFEKILNPEGTVQGVQHIEDSVDYCSLEQHDLESKAAVPSISPASVPLTESMSLISTSDENTSKRTELLQRHSIDQARILKEMSNSLGSIKHSLKSIQEIRAKILKLEMERSKREEDMHLTDMNIKKTQLSIKKKELQLLNLN